MDVSFQSDFNLISRSFVRPLIRLNHFWPRPTQYTYIYDEFPIINSNECKFISSIYHKLSHNNDGNNIESIN